jgi:hypothetical protein
MPDWAPLEESLKPLGVGQVEAAQKLGVPSRPRVLQPRGLRHLRFLDPSSGRLRGRIGGAALTGSRSPNVAADFINGLQPAASAG